MTTATIKIYTVNTSGLAKIESQWLELTGSDLQSTGYIAMRLDEKQGEKMAGLCSAADYEVSSHYTVSKNPEFITLNDEHFDVSEIEA